MTGFDIRTLLVQQSLNPIHFLSLLSLVGFICLDFQLCMQLLNPNQGFYFIYLFILVVPIYQVSVFSKKLTLAIIIS